MSPSADDQKVRIGIFGNPNQSRCGWAIEYTWIRSKSESLRRFHEPVFDSLPQFIGFFDGWLWRRTSQSPGDERTCRQRGVHAVNDSQPRPSAPGFLHSGLDSSCCVIGKICSDYNMPTLLVRPCYQH